jgi:hypothetical protein
LSNVEETGKNGLLQKKASILMEKSEKGQSRALQTNQRFRRENKNKRNQPQLDLTTKTTKCFKINWKSSVDNWCG